MIRPKDEALKLVHEWLSDNGIDKINHSPSKDWIEFHIPTEAVEQLLDTKYQSKSGFILVY